MNDKEDLFIGVDPSTEVDYSSVATSLNNKLEEIDIAKLRLIMEQYAKTHEAFLEERRNNEAAVYVEQYRVGRIDRGTLAKRLVEIGFPQLVVVELLEKNSL